MNLRVRRKSSKLKNNYYTSNWSGYNGQLVLYDPMDGDLHNIIQVGYLIFLCDNTINGLVEVTNLVINNSDGTQLVVDVKFPEDMSSYSVDDIILNSSNNGSSCILFYMTENGIPTIYDLSPQSVPKDILVKANSYANEYLDKRIVKNPELLNKISSNKDNRLVYNNEPVSQWSTIYDKPNSDVVNIDEAVANRLPAEAATAIKNSSLKATDQVLKVSDRYVHPTDEYVPKAASTLQGKVLKVNSNGKPEWGDVLPTDGIENQVLTTNGLGKPEWRTPDVPKPSTDKNGKILRVESGKYVFSDEKEIPASGIQGQILVSDSNGDPKWTDYTSVPEVTSSDVDKVLKATSVGQTGWSNINEVPLGGSEGQVLTTDGSDNFQWKSLSINDLTASVTDNGKLLSVSSTGKVISVDNKLSDPTSVADGHILSTNNGTTEWVSKDHVFPSIASNTYKVLGVTKTNTIDWVDTLPPWSSSEDGRYLKVVDGKLSWQLVDPQKELPAYDSETGIKYLKFEEGSGLSWTELEGVPAHTNSDNDKFIKLVSGTPTWSEAPKGHPTITSSDKSKVLVAGDTESEWTTQSNSLKSVSGYTGTAANDVDKVLKVDANGNPEWTKLVSDVPQILNTDVNKVLTVNSSLKAEWLDSQPGVPTPSASDENKVLTANNSGGYSWQDAPKELPNQVSTDNGKILTADGAGGQSWRSAPSSVPTPAVSDENKVLTANNSQGFTWKEVSKELTAQVSTDNGKVLVADGAGGNSWKELIPASDNTVSGHILTVDANGNPQWMNITESLDEIGGTMSAGKVLTVGNDGNTPEWKELPVPASNNTMTGSILTVNANGDPQWMDITESLSEVNGTPIEGKVLTIGSDNSTPEWRVVPSELPSYNASTDVDKLLQVTSSGLNWNTKADILSVPANTATSGNPSSNSGKVLTINDSNEFSWSKPVGGVTVDDPTNDAGKFLQAQSDGTTAWATPAGSSGSSTPDLGFGFYTNSNPGLVNIVLWVNYEGAESDSCTINHIHGLPSGWSIVINGNNNNITINHTEGLVCTSGVFLFLDDDTIDEYTNSSEVRPFTNIITTTNNLGKYKITNEYGAIKRNDEYFLTSNYTVIRDLLAGQVSENTYMYLQLTFVPTYIN